MNKILIADDESNILMLLEWQNRQQLTFSSDDLLASPTLVAKTKEISSTWPNFLYERKEGSNDSTREGRQDTIVSK